MEQTYIMIKPDGVQRNLVGEVFARIEKKGFKIAAIKMVKLSKETAGIHYGEHREKPFFKGLVDFITSGPVVAMVIEGENVVSAMRKVIGSTNPLDAECGSIRGDYGLSVGRNIIHGSDSLESAKREIAIYFTDQEICDYEKNIEDWIYEG